MPPWLTAAVGRRRHRYLILRLQRWPLHFCLVETAVYGPTVCHSTPALDVRRSPPLPTACRPKRSLRNWYASCRLAESSLAELLC